MDADAAYRIIIVPEDAADGCTLYVKREVPRERWYCYSEACGGMPNRHDALSCCYCGSWREDSEL